MCRGKTFFTPLREPTSRRRERKAHQKKNCCHGPLHSEPRCECNQNFSPTTIGQLQPCAEVQSNGGFDDAWAAINQPKDWESVSPELQPQLRRVYSEVLAAPTDLRARKESLTALLEYLNGQGRTNANCWAIDMFFCLSEGWERDWKEQNLPDDFQDVLALMGEALHDTVRTPKITETFDCLPEQLLARVRRLTAQPGQ